MTKKNTVFVSYSSADNKSVDMIVRMLKQENIAYWKAPEMIPAGSSYAREIPRAIKECKVVLLVLSKTSQCSIWVEKEIDSAISLRKVIIPFQIDDEPLNDTFRFYLNNVQMISLAQDGAKAYTDLQMQLHRLLNPKEEIQIQEEKNIDKRVEKNDFQKEFPKRSISRDSSSNVLRMNRIPLECDHCGSKLIENITMGTYRCHECGKDSYDDFQTIRNYLDVVGTAPANVIEQNTGVPKRIIEYFFRDEYLEIPKNSSIRVPCENCGAPIRTGTLCETCKSMAGKEKKKNSSKNGSWHSLY